MKEIVGRDFEKWRKGDKIKPPMEPGEWDEIIINFFLAIYKIIAVENHTKKYQGKKQIVDILNEAAEVENVNLEFFEVDGEWGIHDTGYTVDDLLGLKRVQYRFSRIYRHHAQDYIHKSDEKVKEMLKDGREDNKES